MKLISILCALFLGACASYTLEQKEINTTKLNDFFERTFNEDMARVPAWQSHIGLKTNYDKLNSNTEEFNQETLELAKKHLKELRDFPFEGLTDQGKISYRLYEDSQNNLIESWKWRYHGNFLNHKYAWHSGTPSFMINVHRIKNVKEAEDYISRLKEFKRVFAENLNYVKKQKELGILPPAFVYDKVIHDSQNIISGYPFTKKGRSPLYADFRKKIDVLEINEKEKQKLRQEASEALQDYVKPAYEELISFVKELQKIKTDNDGAWSLPDGDEYYRFRLKQMTTTDMTPQEIYDFGISEVNRIHDEMRLIMKKIGFTGSLQEFFKYLRTNKEQVYPNTKTGREAYLAQTRKSLEEMEKALPRMFNRLPMAPLKVKAVEKYREKSSGIAFYQRPPLFGKRPGIYYVNLYNMKDVPKYKLEALAYHEGIPGHHLQNAIQAELKGLPKFRRTAHYTAYSEGWGLYSEFLPKEFGFYEDPYSDFGRLNMELWRACRLVTDTGLHYKKWTREEAIDYLKKNTANSDLEIVKGIERYIVNPGQATAYKIGMKKILDLRKYAKSKLGNKFDIRNFHDVILRSGAVPLNVMEELMKKWLKTH